MATEKQFTAGTEWRVTVSDGSSVTVELERGPIARVCFIVLELMLVMRSKISQVATNIWKIGSDDPRKVIHCMKVGLSITLVSIIYYIRPLYDGVGGNAMWAVMTVVVVSEFTVGGCFYKGINRAVATLSAGALAFGTHWIASRSGETMEPIILGLSVFLLASAATFSRFIPTIKTRFDYGITIFILTFSLVAISGYRVDDRLLNLAHQRLSTIAIGVLICLLVSILVCPVWAGEDLHRLIARNMEKLACSLEVCVAEYFNEDGTSNGNKPPSPKSQDYKCILSSKATEDSLANLAKWEPVHGRFGFRHPWSQYLKVGTAVRHCAYCIEALNGCMNSETQAPDFLKKHLSDVSLRLASQSSEVLKELASSIKLMRSSPSMDFLVEGMNKEVQELHNALRSLPRQAITQKHTTSLEEATEEKRHPILAPSGVPLTEALSLLTFASLLIEISSRIEGVIDAAESLARLACFKSTNGDNPKQAMCASKASSVGPEEQA